MDTIPCSDIFHMKHIPNASTVYTMMVPLFSLSLVSSSRSTQYTAKRCIYYFMHYYQEKNQCQTANQAQTTTERLQLQIYRDSMTADHNAVFPRHMMQGGFFHFQPAENSRLKPSGNVCFSLYSISFSNFNW